LHRYELLINPISIPLQVALYDNQKCIKRYKLDGRTSDVLLEKVEEIHSEYNISKIIYVNGPGSYMAIKLTYIMLRTIELISGTPFYGCSAFELNNNNPVRAMGSLYFIKEKETIITQKFDQKIEQEFWVPDNLSAVALAESNKPNYILPAV